MKRKLSTILTVVLFLLCASLVKAQTHVPLEPEIIDNQGNDSGDKPKGPIVVTNPKVPSKLPQCITRIMSSRSTAAASVAPSNWYRMMR